MFVNNIQNKRSIRRGFTLIELLVVIAIISLLVSILLPSLSRAKKLAKAAICRVNQRGIGTAIHMYASESNGYALQASGNVANAGTFPHTARYWGDVLMQGEYISNDTKEVWTNSGYVTASALPEDSILGCPVMELPASHNAGSGTPSFPQDGTRRSTLTTYGLRTIYPQGGWQWYEGEQIFADGSGWAPNPGAITRLPVLGTLKTDVPFLADSIKYAEAVPYEYNTFWVADTDRVIDRRHGDRGHVWFPDGSSQSLTEGQIQALPAANSYSNSEAYPVESYPYSE